MAKVQKKLPTAYYIAPNGMKVELKTFVGAKLTNIEVHEPRADMALTDELKNKGSIDVIFKYDEVKNE